MYNDRAASSTPARGGRKTAHFLDEERLQGLCPTSAFPFPERPLPGLRFRPMQVEKALLYAARLRPVCRLFLGSSAVEHSTVNRMVAGSNPARGASAFGRP